MTADHISSSKQEIQRKYDSYAGKYDAMNLLYELTGLNRIRRKLFKNARGKVLDVAVGTGMNLPCYNNDINITGIDLSSNMLEIARHKANEFDMEVKLQVMDAENLQFPDNSFDTVISSLCICTFPDPLKALQEMKRVCSRNGSILMLEHGRSDREWLGNFQDRKADKWAQSLDCQWNRNPHDLTLQAGLQIIEFKRAFFGMLYIIKARPGKTENC